MKNKYRVIKMILFVIAFPLGLIFFGLLVMYLWNLTLPGVLNVSPINFWQAIGILLLSKLLFGGFPGGWNRRGERWKKNMGEKLARMTPEQRENFKKEWRSRCSIEGWTADKTFKPTKVPESTPE
jgi:hypothetical protein